ncbi:MAG: hypothetical protein K2H42_02040 [Alistipes sp.]|nr:hypothetical protein [Alistipes sp.]
MIKKLIGLLAAAGIIAVLVATVLYRDEYRSMVFEEGTSLRDFIVGVKPAAEPTAAPESDAAESEAAEAEFEEAEE